MSEARVGLVEQFYSIQGEGRNTGRPAVFVRFAGCNLACNFSDDPEDNPIPCDTPWMKAREKKTVGEILSWAINAVGREIMHESHDRISEAQIKVSMAETVEELKKAEEKLHAALDLAPMMVFTGGEPSMQPKLPEINSRAQDAGFYTAIETNGTIYVPVLKKIDWVTVSPKNMIHQGNPVHGEPLADSAEIDEDVKDLPPHEYRYVVDGREAEKPPYYPADKHYISPAIISDGSGTMHRDGFPGFAPGALERAQEIAKEDPRWHLSLQDHKFMGVR